MKRTTFRSSAITTLILSCLSLFVAVSGQATTIEIKNSTSPDEKIYLTIEPTPPDDGDGYGKLQIRNKGTNAILGSFNYQQYRPIDSLNLPEILWKPDSSAFATQEREGLHDFGSEIYARWGERWFHLDQPKFKTKYSGHSEWESNDRSVFAVVAWLQNDLLKMVFHLSLFRHLKTGEKEYVDCEYWVFYKLVSDAKGVHLETQEVREKTEKEQ